jgi:NADH dehydrogenase
MMTGTPHHVVIVGGGFGGLSAAESLRKAPVQVTLLDRRNFHLFQPLLYQVATGVLSPANIASPLRAVLQRQKKARVLLAEVTGIDVPDRRVLLSDGEMSYDTLVIATGARHHYFGHDEWEALAPGLKTIEDATDMRRRILLAFEAAERETDPERLRALLTFVLVGAGPTGLELAGALADVARYTLKHDFRAINTAQARILLLEGMERVLPPYPPKLSAKAAAALARLGVTVWTDTVVTDIQPGVVTVCRHGQSERIAAHTVLWAAGVLASPLGKLLAQATGAALDRAGRITVEPNLTLPGHPELFVIGDLALFPYQGGKPLPGVAPVAIQQGRYVARLIDSRLRGQTRPAFRYKNLGNMAVIGRGVAVADLGWLRIAGSPAWLAWLFIHMINIIQFHNRLLVLVQWGWTYITRNRSARLITGASPLPLRRRE